MVAVPGTVRTTKGVAYNQRQPWNTQVNDGVHHLTTSLHNTQSFLLGSWCKAGNIHQEDSGNVVEITEAHKLGDLARSMNINITGVESAIVADKSSNMSTQTSKGCDHLSGSGRLDFEIVPVVYNLL